MGLFNWRKDTSSSSVATPDSPSSNAVEEITEATTKSSRSSRRSSRVRASDLSFVNSDSEVNSRKVFFGSSAASVSSQTSAADQPRRRTSSAAASGGISRRKSNASNGGSVRSNATGNGERRGSNFSAADRRKSAPSSPLGKESLPLQGEEGQSSLARSASVGRDRSNGTVYETDDDTDEDEDEEVVAEEALRREAPPATKVSPEASAKKKAIRAKIAKLTYEDVKITEKEMNEDLEEVWTAMHLFMNSRMIEAEDVCLRKADHRLYFSVGYTLIQCIKSLMSFEPSDLEAAIQCCSDSLVMANLLRKREGMYESVGRLVRGSAGISSIASMTTVERHSELIYAECLMLRAILGIVYSGDFLSFIKEALNLRSAYAVYRSLGKFCENQDKLAKTKGLEEADDIDQNFKSGVLLGNGMISHILSLLPSKVLKMMEVFGFTGDRDYALKTLMSAGGWSFDHNIKEPGKGIGQEGIRRQVCDMVLLVHHLVISTYLPVDRVDIKLADNILHFNLKRYPEGVFFLYFSGRLYSTQTLGDTAIKQFHKAIQAQREYIQLQHIAHWDLALTYLASAQWQRAYECFNILFRESNWSKAIYAYAKAAMLYEVDSNSQEARQIMKSVPDLMQRIAGKSIPLEKFVARKARKFEKQGGRLLCPGTELAYALNALSMAPRFALFENHLDNVSVKLNELHKCKDPKTWGKNGDEYADDYCLAHLLRGILLRFIAHPEPHIAPRPAKSQIPVEEADSQAMMSFNNVLKKGREIEVDHFCVWFAHYELGRLYINMGNPTKARQELQQVLDGKNMEINPSKKGKGKVSLQNGAVLRSNAALATLNAS